MQLLLETLPRRSFEISRCLGKGGFGEVYAATMTSAQGLETEVALKVLRRDLVSGPVALQRLRDEGRLLARVRHPSIVVVHDLVELGGRVALVTEYVRGQDLAECVGGPDPLPLRGLLEVCAGVAGALDAAWSASAGADAEPLRLVHRDVKPSNVRIGRHGEVKLLDFGIARSDAVTREARTATDHLVGTPGYMAPERYLDAEVRSASDVFSVGVMLAEYGLRRRLFDLPVPVLAGMAVVRDRYEGFLDEHLAGLELPESVCALVRRCLAHAPEARPTAAELARACEALADEVGGPSLVQWCRRRPWPEAPALRGELDGTTLREGTAELPRPPPVEPEASPPTPPPPAALPRPGRGRWLVGGVAGLGAAGLAGLGAVVLVVAVGLGWWLAPRDAPTPRPVEAPAPEVPAPQPEPSPAPEPAPSEPTPPPAVAPVRRPAPAPAVVVTPVPVETVRVEAAGDVVPRVVLGDGDFVVLPGEVPVGTWPVEARFNGRDWRPADIQLVVDPGTTPAVRCSAQMGLCQIE